MAGHSKWKQIKHKKEATDQKRSKAFSKLLNAIAIAARTETNPQFNPRLRSAIEKAKEYNVPQDNIQRAVQRASEQKDLEELLLECYGPGGTQILIEAVTDNRNRTVPEVRKIMTDHGGKWAESGSVQWAFQKGPEGWTAKFPQEVNEDIATSLQGLIDALEAHDDVQDVFTNIQ